MAHCPKFPDTSRDINPHTGRLVVAGDMNLHTIIKKDWGESSKVIRDVFREYFETNYRERNV